MSSAILCTPIADIARKRHNSIDLRYNSIDLRYNSIDLRCLKFSADAVELQTSVTKTRAWNPDTNALSPTAQRQADVYVFALLAHTDKVSIDALDVTQWRFFVLAARALDARTRSQHSITLKSLEALCTAQVGYSGLRHAIEECAQRLPALP